MSVPHTCGRAGEVEAISSLAANPQTSTTSVLREGKRQMENLFPKSPTGEGVHAYRKTYLTGVGV